MWYVCTLKSMRYVCMQSEMYMSVCNLKCICLYAIWNVYVCMRSEMYKSRACNMTFIYNIPLLQRRLHSYSSSAPSCKFHICICDVWYIHTYMDAYIHACMYTYVYACIHTYIWVWYIHTCIHTYMHTCIHADMHTCIHTYMHACIHA